MLKVLAPIEQVKLDLSISAIRSLLRRSLKNRLSPNERYDGVVHG